MKVYMVNISWDCHSETWCAVCDEVPLALEGASFDELLTRIKIAAQELVEINGGEPVGLFHFVAERRDGA